MNIKNLKKEKIFIILLALLLIIAISIVIYLLCSNSSTSPDLSLPTDNNAVQWEGNQSLNNPNNNGKGIAIPGINSLVFRSGQTLQKVNFYNPSENNCLFLMTLYIDDNIYWQSGFVEPGKGFYTIDLLQVVDVGEYQGALKIQCYKPDGTTLNSAKVTFDLIVEE